MNPESSQIAWLICEHQGKSFCLYDERKSKSMDRCVKHGALLSHAPDVRGMPRKVARFKLEKAQASKR